MQADAAVDVAAAARAVAEDYKHAPVQTRTPCLLARCMHLLSFLYMVDVACVAPPCLT